MTISGERAHKTGGSLRVSCRRASGAPRVEAAVPANGVPAIAVPERMTAGKDPHLFGRPCPYRKPTTGGVERHAALEALACPLWEPRTDSAERRVRGGYAGEIGRLVRSSRPDRPSRTTEERRIALTAGETAPIREEKRVMPPGQGAAVAWRVRVQNEPLCADDNGMRREGCGSQKGMLRNRPLSMTCISSLRSEEPSPKSSAFSEGFSGILGTSASSALVCPDHPSPSLPGALPGRPAAGVAAYMDAPVRRRSLRIVPGMAPRKDGEDSAAAVQAANRPFRPPFVRNPVDGRDALLDLGRGTEHPLRAETTARRRRAPKTAPQDHNGTPTVSASKGKGGECFRLRPIHRRRRTPPASGTSLSTRFRPLRSRRAAKCNGVAGRQPESGLVIWKP